jgi:hypothetical protein
MFVAQLLTNNWYAPWYSVRLLRIGWRRYLLMLAPLGRFALGALAASIIWRGALMAVGARDARMMVLAGVVATGLSSFTLAWHSILEPRERASVRTWLKRMLMTRVDL